MPTPQEHYVVEQTSPKWLTTALTSLGAALTGGLLLWIASSQLSITTEIAVVSRNQEVMVEKLTETTSATEIRLDAIAALVNQIWPRLRAHGENMEILRRELEELCQCKIDLKQPEQF
jgi:hypothetical protein